ncbi:MAG: GNAT family N-acetyltransferase [Rhodospirillaceae bacterium]
MATSVSFFPATDPRMAEARRIRFTVFCEEQQVPPDLEWDAHEAVCEHVLADVDGVALGAARIRPYQPSVFKIERVAVVKEARGQGIGLFIMAEIMRRLADRRASAVVLNAQAQVETFYHQLGFLSEGEQFMEAGIPHVHMTWRPSG